MGEKLMRIIPFGKPIIGEEEKKVVCEVMDSGIMAHGPKIKEFETSFADFTKAPYSVGVSNCTAAMHLVYFYLGLGPGDEVIVPAMTHTATAHAVELLGAKPVFVDSEQITGNLDMSAIESKINSRTRAIALVHFLGMPVNMDALMNLAKKHDCFVVEDCALAIGSYYKTIHAGLHGDVGCYSFYPVKHMTTAEGGMIITKHEDLAKKLSNIRAFGMDRHVGERKLPGLYDVQGLGFNYRMNEIQAAIGIEQLKRMDGFLKKREKNYQYLDQHLQNIDEVTTLKSSHDEFQSSYYCHTMILNNELSGKRFDLINDLKSKGIGTSIYYPHPVPFMSYYKNKYGYQGDEFPNASIISDCSIALPVGPHVDKDDIDYMISQIKQAIVRIKQ